MAAGNPGADWKHGRPGAKPAAPTPKTSRKAWQPGAAAPTAKKPRSRGSRFLMAGFGAAVLLAAIVAVILFWKSPKYPEFVLVSPGGNTFAQPISDSPVPFEMGTWVGEPKLQYDTAHDANGWKAKIDRGNGTVLYFSAPGGADAEGPFLWFVPPDATAPDESHKLRVKEILAHLAGQKMDRPKLVVFDLAPMPISFAHGLMFPDFARALKEMDGEIAKVDNLAVICSCDAEERPWAVASNGDSAFSQPFLHGLGSPGSKPGDSATAETLFETALLETKRWVTVNRDERQTVILLPSTDGPARAARMPLISPTTMGTKILPARKTHERQPTPELERQWTRADTLANSTADPAKVREFLETLLRWELTGTPALATKAQTLGDQLSRLADGEPACIALGFGIGPAFGLTVPPPSKHFDALWNPTAGRTMAAEWEEVPDKRSTALRLALAAEIVEQVARSGATADLKKADDLLALVDGGQMAAAETHFVRMLHRRLGAKPPPAPLIAQAIRMVRTAEEAALAGGSSADQVFRWTLADLDAADAQRRRAEDCLFAEDAESWAEAIRLYNDAAGGYKRVRGTAEVVGAALTARDRAFLRLPYYGRWIAGYRGPLAPEAVAKLLTEFEAAMRNAHAIAEAIRDFSAPSEQAVSKLRDATAALTTAQATVETAHADDAARLTNTVSQRNWHALDCALEVPFLKAADRVKLLEFHHFVETGLARGQVQPTATGAPPVSPKDAAARALRVAKALANDADPTTKALLEQPPETASWSAYRQAADRLGRGFRDLPATSAKRLVEAGKLPLAEGAPLLAQASAFARRIDPAATLPGESALLAERRYWRHKLLLNQARRVTLDGWADTGSGPPDEWYCRKAALNYVESAKALVGGTGLSPAEEARRYREADTEANRRAAVLTLAAPEQREIADDPKWSYEFTLRRPADAAVGYPVWWLKEAGEPYHAPSPAGTSRQRDKVLAQGPESVTLGREFEAPGQSVEKAANGELVPEALYRGCVYRRPTTLVLAGAPTLDIHRAPPPSSAPARFAVIADPDGLAIAGAVTILVDTTISMDEKILNNVSRLSEAVKGIERLLPRLPRHTKLVIGKFAGSGGKGFERIDTAVVLPEMDWTGEAEQKKTVLAALGKLAADGLSTPLAGAIREVLSPDVGKKFWPEKFSGTRTLVVVTDGEDNWARPGAANHYVPPKDAFRIVVDALRAAEDDVALHIVFFGMETAKDGDEPTRAFAQFEPVERPEHYRESGRTPAKLHKGIKDAADLAGAIGGATLPRIPFTEQDRLDRAGARSVPVTLPIERVYRLTQPLAPREYFLWAGGRPQRLMLDAGDRVLLRAAPNRRENRLDLELPPIAYELASSPDHPGIPKGESRGEAGNRSALYATLADLEVSTPTPDSELKFTATLETGTAQAGEFIQRAPPLFAWFDADYLDGKPGNPERPRTLRIDNRPGLFAPAWTLQLKRWDVERNYKDIRKPSIDGYWIEKLPGDALPIPLDLRNVPAARGLLPKSNEAQGVAVDIEGIALEPWGEKTAEGVPVHPAGTYLTVRLKYPNAKAKVLLRPGDLAGGRPLHERHTYFDSVGRYTARFGPLTEEDCKAGVTLKAYSVGKVCGEARKAGRAVTVAYPDRAMNNHAMPAPLRPEE